MSVSVVTHAYDNTGTNPLNLVTGELHSLSNSSLRLVEPEFGYFYKKSVIITDTATNTTLDESQYVCLDNFEKESLLTGKEICATIMILDKGVVGPLSLSYRVLGGINSRSSTNILDVFFERFGDSDAIEYSDLKDIPDRFIPKKGHKHPASMISDLGTIMSSLSNIKDAILAGNKPAIDSLYDYIDHIFELMKEFCNRYLNTELLPALNRFKAQFNKSYFGLDKVSNMPTATHDDVRKAAGRTYRVSNLEKNKYILLATLVSFREALYSGIVDKYSTNLGTNDHKFTLPLKEGIINISNGSNRSYIGHKTALAIQQDYDIDLYPVDLSTDKPLTISKINSNKTNGGGIYHLFSQEFVDVYLGRSETGFSKDRVFWKHYTLEGTLDTIADTARRHIRDTGNPHDVTKDQIKLGLVQNYPVVTKEKIQKFKGVKEYLTMDMLIHLMRAFFLQNAWHVKLEENHRNQFLLDNCTLVFSPCGSCGCGVAVPTPPICIYEDIIPKQNIVEPPPPPPPAQCVYVYAFDGFLPIG